MRALMDKLLSHSFVRFLGVGGSATAIDFVIYMLLGRILPPEPAKLISMCCACVYSYCLNKAWTFQDRHKTDSRLVLRFVIAQLINIGVNVGTNSLLLHIAGAPVVVAFAVATAVAMMINFTLQRAFVFR